MQFSNTFFVSIGTIATAWLASIGMNKGFVILGKNNLPEPTMMCIITFKYKTDHRLFIVGYLYVYIQNQKGKQRITQGKTKICQQWNIVHSKQ